MHKTLSSVTVKAADKGEVSAVFSTFNVIDKDGDITLPGAIKDGTEVVISAYQHGSHGAMGGKLPVGKGVIRTTDSEAILEGKFFMNTQHGRDTFETVKQLGGLGEWSYHLANVTAHMGEVDGKQARIIESIGFIKEVSPVLIGAGENTRTLAVKGAGPSHPLGGGVIPAETTAVVDELRKAHAWVDPAGDPESPASYGFRHHKTDGEVDLRECLVGVARLKTGQHTIPEADVAGVYAHLADHLRDADFEPTPLKQVSLLDEIVGALALVSDVKASAARVVALRAEKGKSISQVNADALTWLADELDELKRLLDTPTELLEREHARFIKLKHKL